MSGTLLNPLDPTKHVRFVQGMVLDAPAFRQEFHYLASRDDWESRDLIGYGVVRGLSLGIQLEGAEPEVLVEPGVAITPHGKVARLQHAQCARINQWLKGNKQLIIDHAGSGAPGSTFNLTLEVTLRYWPRDVDETALPPDVCGDASESIAASRVADSFELDFALRAPEDVAGLGRERLAAYLNGVPVVETGGSTMADLLVPLESAPTPSDLNIPSGLSVSRANLPEFYERSLSYYAHKLRARWLGAGEDVSLRPPTEERLLLGSVAMIVTVATNGEYEAPATAADYTITPGSRFLIETDLIRRLITTRPAASSTVTPTVTTGPSTFEYFVVAAGIIQVTKRGVPQPGPATDSHLTAESVGDGWVKLKYRGFGGTDYRYVLKCIAKKNGSIAAPVVSVRESNYNEFDLEVRDAAGGTAAPPSDKLLGLELFVEISAFRVGSP